MTDEEKLVELKNLGDRLSGLETLLARSQILPVEYWLCSLTTTEKGEQVFKKISNVSHHFAELEALAEMNRIKREIKALQS